MSGEIGLTVRRFERRQLELCARVTVDAASSAQVRLSAQTGSRDQGLSALVVDVSEGGMGVRTGLFLPRKAVVRISVFDGPDGEVIFEETVRVQRVSMLDRAASYLLGTAFIERGPDLIRRVNELMHRCGVAGQNSVATGQEPRVA